jgi:hypothetical protein
MGRRVWNGLEAVVGTAGVLLVALSHGVLLWGCLLATGWSGMVDWAPRVSVEALYPVTRRLAVVVLATPVLLLAGWTALVWWLARAW